MSRQHDIEGRYLCLTQPLCQPAAKSESAMGSPRARHGRVVDPKMRSLTAQALANLKSQRDQNLDVLESVTVQGA
jgi:hypothetical protein